MAAKTEPSLQRSKWLHEVGQKLSPEGKLLLKLLYYKSLPQTTLVDKVREPRDLYTQSMLSPDGPDQAGQEHNVLSPDDALAVFIHRLSVLVSQPTGGDQADAVRQSRKDLGAQECLDNLRTCRVTPPPLKAIFSQESKLLECLVKSYVDMTPRQRAKLKVPLGKQVGAHHQNVDVFEVFCKLFQKLNDKDEIIDKFVCALRNARAPQTIADDLERNLGNNDIPHNPFPDPISSEEEDYGDESTALIVLQPVITPIIPEKRPARCTRRLVACCLVPCIPIVLAILAIVASTGSFSGLDQSAHSLRQFEVSSNYPQHCPASHATALTRLGRVNSFWYREVVIYQDEGEHPFVDYTWEELTFYAIPSERVEVETDKFSCTIADSILNIFPLYLLEGSNMTFHICIATSADADGAVNLTIFDDIVNYYLYRGNHYNVTFAEQYLLKVDANKSNCSDHSFVAQHDSFYYVLSGNQRVPSANITFCRFDVDMRYLNSSILSGTQACVSTERQHTECNVPIGSGAHWFLSPQDYDIIASVAPSPSSTQSGKLKIRSVFRSAVYLIPAVAGVVLFGPMFIVCACASFFVCRRKGIKKTVKDEEE